MCSDLFKPVQTFSTPVYNCSHPFPPVHTCSHFSDYLRSSRNGSFSLNFTLVKSENCYFVILRAILLRLHIFAHLIESYSTVSGLSNCIENISIPQAAHTTVTMYARRKMSFFALSNALIFSVLRPILLKLQILTCLIESFPT